jgi:Uma2 family endonuclease
LLTLHVRSSGRGEVFVSPFDVIMSNITVVEPDIVYVDEPRLSRVSERGVESSPTLVIEIDRRRKFALYASHDVTWYWIADPDARTIEVYHLEAGAYRLDATLEGVEPCALSPFPDLLIDPAGIWL